MLECKECGMWRLLYAKSKLSVGERTALQQVLDKWSFTCGAQLQDLNLTGRLADVYVTEMSCNEPIERLHYSASMSLFVSTVLPPSQSQTLSFIPSVLAAGAETEFARASSCLSYICMFTIGIEC